MQASTSRPRTMAMGTRCHGAWTMSAAVSLLFLTSGIQAATMDLHSTAGGNRDLSGQMLLDTPIPWQLLQDTLTRATGSGDLTGHELLYSENGRRYRIIFDRLAGQTVVAAIYFFDRQVPADQPAGDDATYLLTRSAQYLPVNLPSGSLGLWASASQGEDVLQPRFTPFPIPEPATASLALLGASFLLLRRSTRPAWPLVI